MRCLICKQDETRPGVTTVTLERDALILVIKGVPAQVCPNCGEAYVVESVTAELLQTAKQMAAAGAQVDVRQYVPAAAALAPRPARFAGACRRPGTAMGTVAAQWRGSPLRPVRWPPCDVGQPLRSCRRSASGVRHVLTSCGLRDMLADEGSKKPRGSPQPEALTEADGRPRH